MNLRAEPERKGTFFQKMAIIARKWIFGGHVKSVCIRLPEPGRKADGAHQVQCDMDINHVWTQLDHSSICLSVRSPNFEPLSGFDSFSRYSFSVYFISCFSVFITSTAIISWSSVLFSQTFQYFISQCCCLSPFLSHFVWEFVSGCLFLILPAIVFAFFFFPLWLHLNKYLFPTQNESLLSCWSENEDKHNNRLPSSVPPGSRRVWKLEIWHIVLGFLFFFKLWFDISSHRYFLQCLRNNERWFSPLQPKLARIFLIHCELKGNQKKAGSSCNGTKRLVAARYSGWLYEWKDRWRSSGCNNRWYIWTVHALKAQLLVCLSTPSLHILYIDTCTNQGIKRIPRPTSTEWLLEFRWSLWCWWRAVETLKYPFKNLYVPGLPL